MDPTALEAPSTLAEALRSGKYTAASPRSSYHALRQEHVYLLRKDSTVPPLTVVIADDHTAVRTSLQMLLEGAPDLQLIGEATNGLEAIRAVHALKPDLLLTDIKMPMMTGLEVLQYLRNEKNALLIVVLSNHSEPLYVEAAMRLGANAFVAKASGLETLLEALATVRTGQPYVDPNIGWTPTDPRPPKANVSA